jgi:hypothetical protein
MVAFVVAGCGSAPAKPVAGPMAAPASVPAPAAHEQAPATSPPQLWTIDLPLGDLRYRASLAAKRIERWSPKRATWTVDLDVVDFIFFELIATWVDASKPHGDVAPMDEGELLSRTLQGQVDGAHLDAAGFTQVLGRAPDGSHILVQTAKLAKPIGSYVNATVGVRYVGHNFVVGVIMFDYDDPAESERKMLAIVSSIVEVS